MKVQIKADGGSRGNPASQAPGLCFTMLLARC